MRFENREDSGFHLSALLLEKKIRADYVITIPRGGVPVAIVISKKLQLPLKLVFVRKLGHPINSEFAIGAVTEKNMIINNDVFINNQHPEIETLIQKERKRIFEMKARFNHEFSFQEIKQKNIILVDDGIATGTCIELAIQELRKNGARTITVATPICPFNTYQKLKKIADEIICCIVTEKFSGISAYFQNFEQLTDEVVVSYLKQLNSYGTQH
jgi:predicted phosphoribosyltransferase